MRYRLTSDKNTSTKEKQRQQELRYHSVCMKCTDYLPINPLPIK